MHVNVVELSLKNNQGKYIDFRFRTESMERSEGFILTNDEAEYARQCLTGTAKFVPYLDDGIHLVKFHRRGFVHLYTGNSRFDRDDVVFPGQPLADAIGWLLQQPAGTERVFGEQEIAAWRERVAPRVRWIYGSWGGYDQPEISVRDRLFATIPEYPALKAACDNLTQIAENYSDGLENTVTLRFDEKPRDDRPPSFYFEIRDYAGQLIMNGGIIAHPRYQYPADEMVDELRAQWQEEYRAQGTPEENILLWTKEDYAVKQHFAIVVGYEYSTHT
jgi:hypothetical protein